MTSRDSNTGFKGVRKNRNFGFTASISQGGKTRNLGTFTNAAHAALARAHFLGTDRSTAACRSGRGGEGQDGHMG